MENLGFMLLIMVAPQDSMKNLKEELLIEQQSLGWTKLLEDEQLSRATFYLTILIFSLQTKEELIFCIKMLMVLSMMLPQATKF